MILPELYRMNNAIAIELSPFSLGLSTI